MSEGGALRLAGLDETDITFISEQINGPSDTSQVRIMVPVKKSISL